MLGKLKSMISIFRDDVINFIPIKGFMLSIDGNGTSNPTINNQYNISSVVRTGVGIYRITIEQETFYGSAIITAGIATTGFSITSSSTGDAHFVAVNGVGSNVFDIEITELTQGSGNRIDLLPFDIEVGDRIDILLVINAGLGKLPPE